MTLARCRDFRTGFFGLYRSRGNRRGASRTRDGLMCSSALGRTDSRTCVMPGSGPAPLNQERSEWSRSGTGHAAPGLSGPGIPKET
jgi:hypothetical protein